MTIKRNNPGNIRKAANSKWQGELPGTPVGQFVTFDSLVNGYRAQIKLLNNYVIKEHDTLTKIINRWAPPSDNNPTNDYINFVSKKTAIGKDEKIVPNNYEALSKIALAMSFFEHGIRDEDGTLSEAITRARALLDTITTGAKENPLMTAAILATLYFLIKK